MKPLFDADAILPNKKSFTRSEVIALLENVLATISSEVNKRYVAPLNSLEARIVELKDKNQELVTSLIHKKNKVEKLYQDNPGRAKRISTKIDKAIAANSVSD
jgi:hypothetical protein